MVRSSDILFFPHQSTSTIDLFLVVKVHQLIIGMGLKTKACYLLLLVFVLVLTASLNHSSKIGFPKQAHFQYRQVKAFWKAQDYLLQ